MIVKGFVFVYLSAMFLGGFVSVYQEQKIWRNPKLPNLTLVGMFKVYIMNLLWMLLCTIGILLTPFYCLYTGSLNTRKWAHHIVEKFVATTITSTLIGPVEIRGAEHIPDASLHKVPAPVLIANHASQADIAVVYFLNCEWRWIAKSSVMFLPGVGLLMWLADHVFIDRVKKSNKNKNSFTGARHLYTQSNASIQEGVPMFFFPQGTRRLGERLPFKDGAFRVALENESPVIPVSLDIPLTTWNSWHPFEKTTPTVITVHPPIPSKGKDLESLKKEAIDTIYSVLPDFSKQD